MHWDARCCLQLHKQSGAQLRFVVKLHHARYGKMMLEVIEYHRGSAYAGKNILVSRLTYVQLVHLWKSQFSRSTDPIKRRCSRHKTETTGSAINVCKRRRWFVCWQDQKWRNKNKIWSDVSLPVNCRCEVCVRSPNDLARKAGGVAGLADFDARCRR